MIATHNIKVNGRWIHAGEEYKPEKDVTPKKAEKADKEPEAKVQEEIPAEKIEQPVTEVPKTASRRKKVSE